MNNLEKYIGDLNPSCWYSAENVNGFGNSQPLIDDEVPVFKNIGNLGPSKDMVKPTTDELVVNQVLANKTFLTYPRFKKDENQLSYLEFTISLTAPYTNMDCLSTPIGGFGSNLGTLIQVGRDSTIISSRGAGNPPGTMAHFGAGGYSWMYGVPYTTMPVNAPSLLVIGNQGSGTYWRRKPNYLCNVMGYHQGNKMWYGFLGAQLETRAISGAALVPANGNSDNSLQNMLINVNGIKQYNYCYDEFQTILYSIGGIYSPNALTNGYKNVLTNGTSTLKVYEVIFIPRLLTIEEMKQVSIYLKLKYNI